MFAHTAPISCNFPSLHSQNPNKLNFSSFKSLNFPLSSSSCSSLTSTNARTQFPLLTRTILLQTRRNSLETDNSQDPDFERLNSMKTDGQFGGAALTTSFLLFLLWGGLMYYVFNLAPNQTPSTDTYLLKKLCYLIGDDGFQPNQVIVSLWNIMGLWPLVYCMLLIPSGRSSKGKVPVFPFVILSFFLGAYALIPYFVLWRPPPPATEESELKRWPLNFLESKLTAGVVFVLGLGLIIYAGLATGDDWKEYLQYFGGSKLIHVTSIDFALLSTFAPFWVYNDMTARKWNDKGFWLLPLSVIPFLGPALYILLRPSLSAVTIAPNLPATKEE